MKKKILFVSFAVIIFLLTAFVLLKTKEKGGETVVNNESKDVFSEIEIKAAQDLQVDPSMQEKIFSQTDLDAAVNQKIPADEEEVQLFEKIK